MNRVLTDEQRALVEQNHHVIYCVIKRTGLSISEMYGVAALQLCKAALSFKGTPEHFFRYAYVAVRRAVWAEYYRQKRYTVLVTDTRATDDTYDELGIEDCLASVRPYLTQKEITALTNVLTGEPCSDASMAAARHRALAKCRRLMCGEQLVPVKERYSDEQKKRAVELRAHGYKVSDINVMTGIPERTIRAYYNAAGKPMYRTSADIARLLGVDRTTVLRHAVDVEKKGHKWEIKTIPKIYKPSKRHSKNYTEDEIALLLSSLPDWVVAQKIGRTENAVHIKRWRLRNENHHTKATTPM